MPNLTPESDPICSDLGLFLATKLNEAYEDATIVRSIRQYDAYDVPFQDHPLLKVYRTSDIFSFDNSIRETQMGVAYCLVNTELAKLPGVTNWVAETVVIALREYGLHKQGCVQVVGAIQANYRTLLQLGELIYQIDFRFGIKE